MYEFDLKILYKCVQKFAYFVRKIPDTFKLYTIVIN